MKYYNQALPIQREVGDHSGEATTLTSIGAVFDDIGQPEEALNFYNQALPIRREVGDRRGEATTLNNIGFVYRYSNQSDKAIATWEESIEITLEIRQGLGRNKRQAFIESKDNTAIALVDLLIKQRQYQKAFEWANLVTTFDLADYNRLIDAKVANPEAQKAIDNWNQQNKQLQLLRTQLEEDFDEDLARRMRDKKAEVFKLAENIITRFPDVAELFETTSTDIAKLQQNIPEDTLVIQPVLLTNTTDVDNTIAFFLVTQDSLSVFQHDINPEEFNTLVTTYRNQLADFQNADIYETSSQLYNLYFS